MAQTTQHQPVQRNIVRETDSVQPVREPVVVRATTEVPVRNGLSGQKQAEPKVRKPGPEPEFYLQKISDLIWLVLGVAIAMIGLRVVLKLIAADPANEIARFVYDSTGPLVAPFVGLAPTPSTGDLVFETFSLVAMLVYALAAWVLVRLVWLLFEPPSAPHYRENFSRHDR
jgi:uncharacterized protein YggT (Ycf19 family)